jgi:hypothetical protein
MCYISMGAESDTQGSDKKLGMVAHLGNPNTREADPWGLLASQPRIICRPQLSGRNLFSRSCLRVIAPDG